MEQMNFDAAKAESFAGRMVDVINNGALALMTSIGHRTGLFDVMESMPPSTSEEIATTSGLDERYVREWLSAMAVSGVVECHEEGPRFALPPEHAACLTRESTPDNVAVFAQYIPLLGTVEDQIVDCFKEGGGVPYSEFTRFHEVMAEDSGQSVLPALIESILPLADGCLEKLEEGIDVLDVGCGSGRALNLMAQKFPRSCFTGYDLSEEAVQRAAEEARRLGLTNVTFEARDLTEFDIRSEFDLITAFDAIHDQARPDKVLSGIFRALRPDGFFLMQDIAGSSHVHKNRDHPLGTLLYTVSCMHCMTVSLAQDGFGLGAMWGEETAREMLQEAGFAGISVRNLPHDMQNSYYVVTRD